MEPIKNIVAVLPNGRFFDELYETVLSSWSRGLGASLARMPVKAVSAGAVATSLENAEMVLVDISSQNALGLFSAGYALGIGKRVILLAQIENDCPFMAGNQTLIIYSGNPETLKAGLENLARPQPKRVDAHDAREKFQSLFGEILRAHQHEHRGEIQMENPQTFVLLDQDMDLALVQALSRHARELGVRLKLM